MFGVVPKTIWNKTSPADSNNRCSFAMRSLLIEDGDRLILIDTGLGDKQSKQFFSYYDLHGEATLTSSLAALGFHCDDVTDVILTHLHFDHVGGGVKFNKDRTQLELQFKNAKYWSNKNHWQLAKEPNPREAASFLTENILPIEESGQLHFIESGKEFGNQFSFLLAHGHTESQIIPHINYKGKTIVFCADLLPTAAHIPLPYVMSYDTQPLVTMKEKEQFLTTAYNKDYVLFLQHDALHECCSLKETEKGIRLNATHQLFDVL